MPHGVQWPRWRPRAEGPGSVHHFEDHLAAQMPILLHLLRLARLLERKDALDMRPQPIVFDQSSKRIELCAVGLRLRTCQERSWVPPSIRSNTRSTSCTRSSKRSCL